MRKRVQANRVTVLVNMTCADYSKPVLERFDFIVATLKYKWKLVQFLCHILRRNGIVFEEIIIEQDLIWAKEDQLWSRKRIEGCISNSGRVAAMFPTLYLYA